jgi:hypothetical protein
MKAQRQRQWTPTRRQQAYVHARLAGNCKRRAALLAGYSENSARRVAERIECRPGIKRLFAAELERVGVTDELLAQRIVEGLAATRTIFVSLNGKVTDRLLVVDYRERRQTVVLCLKVKGYL